MYELESGSSRSYSIMLVPLGLHLDLHLTNLLIFTVLEERTFDNILGKGKKNARIYNFLQYILPCQRENSSFELYLVCHLQTL